MACLRTFQKKSKNSKKNAFNLRLLYVRFVAISNNFLLSWKKAIYLIPNGDFSKTVEEVTPGAERIKFDKVSGPADALPIVPVKFFL